MSRLAPFLPLLVAIPWAIILIPFSLGAEWFRGAPPPGPLAVPPGASNLTERRDA